jgi:ketosteroid isomerase-like protein
MKHGIFSAVLSILLVSMIGPVPGAVADVQFPRAAKTNADEGTVREFEDFYEQIEAALTSEDIDRIMSFYAEDYLHHGITKKQLKFMWLEIFSEFSDLYSVHIFTRVDVHGGDAILVCTGALLGIPPEGGDYQTVDRWVTQNHWLTKVDGQWRMIGGATHESPISRGSRKLELHPLF